MKTLYWGYIDYEEKIHVKLYRDDRAIRNAQDSGTTIAIIDPFYAPNIESATDLIITKWREKRVFFKEEIKPKEPKLIITGEQ